MNRKKRFLNSIMGVSMAIIIMGSMFLMACAQETPATDQPITLVFSTWESNTVIYYAKFWKPWMDEIEKRTDGKVKIEAHFNGELGAPPDHLDLVLNGTVDIANVHLQNTPEKFPLADVTAFTTYSLINQRPSFVMWELYNKYPELQK